jgi:LacI family transcriptional regulator
MTRGAKLNGVPGVARSRQSEKVTVALTVDANRWLREEARARGWRLFNVKYHFNRLPSGVVPQGALVDCLPDHELVLKWRRSGIPVVRLGLLPHPDDVLVPAVLPDQAAEGRLAADHFHERGFRDVGYVGNDPWSEKQLLFEGFRARAESLGMVCHLTRFRHINGETNEDKRARQEREFAAWLRGVTKPLGLLVSGIARAVTQCSWADVAGFSVPDDVAVLSIGNMPGISESTIPTISTVELDHEGLMHSACNLLARMMAGEPVPKAPAMISPREVVERESTNVLATTDAAVAVALRYMQNHLQQDLSVEMIAEQAGLSSRQLVRRFQKALHRSVTDETLRQRLEETKRLLRSTDIRIIDIAPMVGFHSTTYLHRAFRRAFGQTPEDYRHAGR